MTRSVERMFRVAAISVLASAIAACNNPVAVSQSDATDIASRITYTKDRYGVCYAVIASVNSYGSVNSITAVPCAQVGML